MAEANNEAGRAGKRDVRYVNCVVNLYKSEPHHKSENWTPNSRLSQMAKMFSQNEHLKKMAFRSDCLPNERTNEFTANEHLV